MKRKVLNPEQKCPECGCYTLKDGFSIKVGDKVKKENFKSWMSFAFKNINPNDYLRYVNYKGKKWVKSTYCEHCEAVFLR